MLSQRPLQLSRLLLMGLGTRFFLHYENRLPVDMPILVVSNHRSFMDAPLLMAALNCSIRFACHHYMSQTPILRNLVVDQLGCFPLDEKMHRQQSFFQQATQLLQANQMVGVFPEGAHPMLNQTRPEELQVFHRGFAHLALRVPVASLAVLPVAIVPYQESVNASAIPLRLLRVFDPSEPLFDQDGWHPMVFYHRVNIMLGRPYWITPAHQQQYQGKQAKNVANELTQYCWTEISDLMRKGFA